jgi:hypothetical protein
MRRLPFPAVAGMALQASLFQGCTISDAGPGSAIHRSGNIIFLQVVSYALAFSSSSK